MKIAAFGGTMSHFGSLMSALCLGMEVQGDEVVHGELLGCGDVQADVSLVWGWRRGLKAQQRWPGRPVLVMERGYVGDRFLWTSLGWNGLNGHAKFPKPPPNQLIDRFRLHFGHPRPWATRQGYALILGQVPSDAACRGVNLATKYRGWASQLKAEGWNVKFRPHPKAQRLSLGFPISMFTRGTLEEALAGAAFSVSWNSNSSVDSVLQGVPSVTLDRGAMAYPVTSHMLSHPIIMPAREDWASQLAWCQWLPEELATGEAWKHVRTVIA